jgi:hypothetical protein
VVRSFAPANVGYDKSTNVKWRHEREVAAKRVYSAFIKAPAQELFSETSYSASPKIIAAIRIEDAGMPS